MRINIKNMYLAEEDMTLTLRAQDFVMRVVFEAEGELRRFCSYAERWVV